METTTDSKSHIAILPGPGLGHLIPVLELAKQLVAHHGFQVSICMVSAGESSPARTQIIRSAKTTSKFLNIVHLPPVDFTNAIPPKASIFSRLYAMMRLSMPALKSALSALEARPAVLITDQFGAECLEVARELGIPNYVYFPVSAWTVALTVFVPVLDKEIVGQYSDQTEPIQIPGCRSLSIEHFPASIKDRTGDQYEDFMKMAARSMEADGFLVNTWEGLQSSTLVALRKLTNGAPVYDVGPNIARPTGSRDHELFGWLDNQPVGSVLYVCFGSGGTLSMEQTSEIAHGLELSQHRFIWVARPPLVRAKDGAFFSAGAAGDDPSSYLPDGFLDRTREVGLVIPQWAPQVDVLAHPSVGGFWSHCGWNSCLEAIANGLPLIVWPLFGEQMMNAGLLAEELGVAMRPKVLPFMGGVVRRQEIADLVRKVMGDNVDGARIRSRVKELKESADGALMEGIGSSFLALSRLANDIRKKSDHVSCHVI